MASASGEFKDRKSRECEAGHCSERQSHLYLFPNADTDYARHKKWCDFVSLKRANFKSDKQSKLCFKHFSDASFSNLGRYKQGIVKV